MIHEQLPSHLCLGFYQPLREQLHILIEVCHLDLILRLQETHLAN
jgi:hypothetical protein